MNTTSLGFFNEISENEMLYIDGGWTTANTIDVAVAVGCAALGFIGPGGAILAACISVGYTVGRGL